MSPSFKPAPPPIRQQGFHLPSPPREDDMSEFEHHVRPTTATSLDFTDDMISLSQDYPRTTHNIFDISAPQQMAHHFALNPQQQQQQQQQQMHDAARLDFPTHFNSTLPALNSSMRYEPHPDPPVYRPDSRSRSSSRPPTGGLGPVRTRRGNSMSSVGSGPSPPPGSAGRPHPHAIVIPGGQRPGSSSWLASSSGHDPYSLPTPDSLHSPSLLSSHQHSNQFSPFGFSPSQHEQQHPYGSLPSQQPPSAVSPVTGAMNGLGFHHHQQSPVTPTPSSVPNLPTPASSSGSVASTTPTGNQSAAEKIANEKRRRRRESHNAVERRRRDNINERIGELATLIPDCMLNDSLATTSTGENDDVKEGSAPPRNPNSGMKKGEDGVVKANKGMILRKSVDYIRYLQELVDAQGQRNRQLEDELKAYRNGEQPPPTSNDSWMQIDTSSSASSSASFNTSPSSAPSSSTSTSFDLTSATSFDPSPQFDSGSFLPSYPIGPKAGSDEGSPLTQIEEDDSEDPEGDMERGRSGRRVKREA